MRKKSYWPSVGLGIGMIFWLAAAARAEESQTLGIGAQTAISIEASTRFSVGNSEVIQVKSTHVEGSKSLLLIKGKSQGYSDLVLLGGKGVRRVLAFRVVSKRQEAMAKDGQNLLSAPAGLKLRPNGGGWLAEGKAKTLDDWNVVSAMQAQEKGKFESLVKLRPLERLHAEDAIRHLLAEANLDEIKVMGAGNTVVVYGDAGNQQEKDLAELLARQVLRDVQSHIRVPFEKGGRLRFRAKILEVMRTGITTLGLQWGDSVPSAVQVAKNITKLNFSLDAALNLLEKNGQARLLSQPELLLNEKGVAELQVGGEIPIQLQTRYFAGVEWKQYGLTMKLELPGVSRQTARAHITVEISSLDPANGVDGIPGIRKSRMDTQVDMEIGKAVVLSGLMENQENRNISRLPGLGDIPILGELFKSRDFQENRSELVIMIEAGA